MKSYNPDAHTSRMSIRNFFCVSEMSFPALSLLQVDDLLVSIYSAHVTHTVAQVVRIYNDIICDFYSSEI